MHLAKSIVLQRMIHLMWFGCAVICGSSFAAELAPVSLAAGQWEQKLFVSGDSAQRDQACQFARSQQTKYGTVLAVGPWRRGKWSARWQSRRRWPVGRATITGMYRTQKLPLHIACVSVSFYKEGRRIGRREFPLAPAAKWAPFRVIVRYPPEGTDALSLGFGLKAHTNGRVKFARLAISRNVSPLSFPADPGPLEREKPPRGLKASGFHRIERIGKTWWLVSPEGQAWYSRGTVGPSFPKTAEGLRQAADYAAQIRRYGFNTLAGWTSVWRWRRFNQRREDKGQAALPIFYAMQSNTLKGEFDYLADALGQTTGEGHAFPDPFDPRFAAAYRRQAGAIAAMVRDKRWFVGWFADNEVSHRNLHRHVYSRHAGKAFVAFLAQRYGAVTELNAAWSVKMKSFADVLEKKPDPIVRTGKMYADFHDFAAQIVRKYVGVTHGILKSADRDHLIFSNRFMLSGLRDAMLYLKSYEPFDGIAVNIYPANRSPGLSSGEKAILRAIHDTSAKPLLIGEWSVPAMDSGLYRGGAKLDWSWNEVVGTQRQRGRQAACIARDFHNLHFVVGAHWFTWGDFDSVKRRANRGLVRSDGKTWRELTHALSKLHAEIDRHEGK